MSGDNAVSAAMQAYGAGLKTPQKLATRVASQKAIEALLPSVPDLFGGSADLTDNNTKVGTHSIFSADNYAGNYVHFGVREHGMAAAMNGIACMRSLWWHLPCLYRLLPLYPAVCFDGAARHLCYDP